MSLRRKNLAFRYMWTAWLSLFRVLVVVFALVGMGVAVGTQDSRWLVAALIGIGVLGLAQLLFLAESPAVRCLGCGGTLLRTMSCSKHRTAKRWLGSYSLYCTLVLATYAKSVHCPYCGMRYRISRRTRPEMRREEEAAEERARAEEARKEAERRKTAEAHNKPYY